jgi:hypothetical protein
VRTLASPTDLAAIRDRIATLTPEDAARWGTMTVNQMLCHLRDSYEVPLGERAASPVKLPSIPLGLLKWLALRAPMEWSKGFPTAPEVNQRVAGTPPVEFAADRAALLSKLSSFAASLGPWASHPSFGQLTTEEWLRWGYLHADHHLRQFGR